MSRRTKNEMRFYSNENFPLPAVEKLRQLGHDVLTVAESGHAGQAWADEEVLRFATKDRRAVLTMNRRHFIRLHDARLSTAGSSSARLIRASRLLPNESMRPYRRMISYTECSFGSTVHHPSSPA